NLGRPSQPLEEPGYLALAIGDAELFMKNPDDPLACPEVSTKAIRLRAMPQEVGDEPELFVSKLSHRAGARMGEKRLAPAALGCGKPSADGGLGRVECGRNSVLFPAQLRKLEGSDPPPFPPVVRLEIRGSHA